MATPDTNAPPTPATVIAAPDFSTDEVLIHAGSLLRGSGHPLERMTLELVQRQGIALLPAAYVDRVSELGLTGRVNGKICVIGGESVMAQAAIDTAPLRNETAVLQRVGAMHAFLSIGDHLAGVLMEGASP